MVKSVTVRAPCSTANLGPGFDVFGMALDALYDNVVLTKKGKGIIIVSSDNIPLNPSKFSGRILSLSMLLKLPALKAMITGVNSVVGG